MRTGPAVHDDPDVARDLYPGRAAQDSPARAILAGRHADVPVVIAAVLLIATPFFGGLPAWPVLAAAILGAAFMIPVMLRTRGTRQGP
jgi:hypothetical protein